MIRGSVVARLSRAAVALRRRATAEEGFGLIELMVAIVIVMVALLAIAYTAITGFQDIAFARQRQSATGLANQAIEDARALPLDTLARGLSNADLSAGGDTNITSGGCGSGTVYCLKVDGLNEQIPRGDNPSVVPLVPHTQTIAVGPTTYTVRTYVSYYQNDPTTNTLRLTAIVTWAATERAGLLHTVDVQSLVAAPPGCLSTRTHPFAAPCQPFLYSTASSGQGHVDVSGQLSDQTVDHMSFFLQNFSSAIQVEQVSAVQGNAVTSGLAAALDGQAETSAGIYQVSSGSDNDPAQAKPPFQTSSAPAQSLAQLTLTGTGATLTGTKFAGGSAVTTSTVSASAAPSNPCPNIGGFTNLTTNLPCGGSTAQQGGQGAIQLAVNSNGADIGTGTLASVSQLGCSGACPNQAISERFLLPNGTSCPGATTDGCIHGEAARSIGQVRLGGLPANVSGPAGWQGYMIQLASFQDTASAESGVGSTDPTLTAPVAGTGSVSFWNGTGYTTCTVYQAGCATGGANFPVTALNRTVQVNGQTVNVSISARITAGGTSITEVPSSCSGSCTRTQTQVTSGSPLLGDLTYTVTVAGTVVCSLNVHVDLGSLLVNTVYKPAPTS
jgi:type II secretory pathway pseudopilin PulG